jgi:hypothetical protein
VRPSDRSRGTRIFLGVVFATVVASGANIVRTILQDKADHDSQAISGDVITSLITFGSILIVWVAIGLSLIPGQRRLRILRAKNPTSLVFPARWNPEFGEYVLSNYLPGLRRPNQIRGIAFTVVADRAGMQIWIGIRSTRKVAMINWTDIQTVAEGSKAISPIKTVETIDVQLSDASLPLQFAVASQGWAGAFPADAESIQALVDDLRKLRLDSTNSPA